MELRTAESLRCVLFISSFYSPPMSSVYYSEGDESSSVTIPDEDDDYVDVRSEVEKTPKIK